MDAVRTNGRLRKAALVAVSGVAAAAAIAVPSGAAMVAAQADDAQVSPVVREAVVAAASASPTAAPGPGRVGAAVAGAPLASAPIDRAAGALPATATPPTGAATAGAPQAPPAAAKKVVAQRDLLKLVKKNFPADQVGNAMAVAQCESGQRSIVGDTNPDGTTDWGVFQLNDAGTLQSSLQRIGVKFTDLRGAQTAALNPTINVKAAGAIYRDRGWAPWVCAYKQQIVASLYTNDKGPMYGRYSAVGGSLGSLKPSDAALAKAKQKAKDKAKQAAKDKAKADAKAKEKAKGKGKNPPTSKPSGATGPSPTPTPSTTEAQPPTP